MRVAGRLGWVITVAIVAFTAVPSDAVTATLTARRGVQTEWRLAEPVDWPADQLLEGADGQLRLHLTELDGRNLRAVLVSSSTAFGEPLGSRLELVPLANSAVANQPLVPPAAPSLGQGTITRVEGRKVWVQVSRQPQPDRYARFWHDGRPAGRLTWGAAAQQPPRTWRATVSGTPRVGDLVSFDEAAPDPNPPSEATVTPPGRILQDNQAQETPLPGDNPLYAVFASLARSGILKDISPRFFDGDHVASYTRVQLSEFLEPVALSLTRVPEAVWCQPDSLPPLNPHLASQLLWLCDSFSRELSIRGVDLPLLRQRLRERGANSSTFAVHASATTRFKGGETNVVGQTRATAIARLGGQTRAGLQLNLETRQDTPHERDRTNLAGWFVETDLSRHLLIGAGRRATRYNAGANSLFWSDNAAPPDSLYLRYQTKLFGRQFNLRQQVGTYLDVANGRKYVAVRRYEYLPANRLTLGANMGLVTDRAGQAAAAMVMPIYFSRFVSGKRQVGGNGNMIMSFDAAYRFDREFAIYGEYLIDDIDVSPSPPHTSQRVGYLAGVQYTPKWALPGTSYRFETATIPDIGTYVTPKQTTLGWTRNGYTFGHPYLDDATGYRLSIEHRLMPRLELRAHAEYYRQRRSSAVPGSRKTLDFGAFYDLGTYVSLGIGYRLDEFYDRASIKGNDLLDDSLYLEARAGY